MINNEELESWINELRCLVFLETEEGDFEQLAFTPEQFKKLSDLITSFYEKVDLPDLKDGHEALEMQTVEDVLIPKDVFEDLNSINQ